MMARGHGCGGVNDWKTRSVCKGAEICVDVERCGEMWGDGCHIPRSTVLHFVQLLLDVPEQGFLVLPAGKVQAGVLTLVNRFAMQHWLPHRLGPTELREGAQVMYS